MTENKKRSIHEQILDCASECAKLLEFSNNCDRNLEQYKNRINTIIRYIIEAIVILSAEISSLKKENELLKKKIEFNNKEN